MKPAHENRKYERFLVSHHLDCKIRLQGLENHLVQLSDISDGGMMVLLSSKEDIARFSAQQEIQGEIVSDNIEIQMSFSGKIVWKRDFLESGRQFSSMGIQFASSVKLPEAIREMLASEED